MNRDNLMALATYLESGHLRGRFAMSSFDDGTYNTNYPTDCRSSGCMIGHSPYAGIEKFATESWWRYSERVFDMHEDSVEWAWLFSGYWDAYDNTPEGGAARIRYLLYHGKPPDWFSPLANVVHPWEHIALYAVTIEPYWETAE